MLTVTVIMGKLCFSFQKRALPGVFSARERGEERHDLFPECGDIAVHDHPDLVRIHAKVCVNQNVPETDHLFPGNARRSASQLRGKACGRFPDDLKVVDHPDLHALIQDLEEALGCRVDVVTVTALKERYKKRILKEAVPL